MKASTSRSALWLIAVPIAAALIATALFAAQGGFAGGHGDLDQAIALLGLPAVLLLETVPLPPVLEENDLLLVIWFPAIVNAVIWATIGAGIQVFRRAHEMPNRAAARRGHHGGIR